jgi:hypothetical protein
MHPRSLFSLAEQLERLSKDGARWRFWQARWSFRASTAAGQGARLQRRRRWRSPGL